MLLFRLTLNEPEYDVDEPAGRLYLRNDLERLGFFKIEENAKYYDWFTQTIKRIEFLELFKAMRLFAHAKLLQPWEKEIE